MKKKALPILLSGAIILNTGLSSHVLANSNQEVDSNIKIISESLDNFTYTYTENGTNFKVIEDVNEDRSYIYSEIYKMNDNKYILDSTSEFRLNNETNEYTYELSNANGQIISRESDSLSNLVQVEYKKEENSSRAWHYVETRYGNGKITSYTVQVALTAIGATLGAATGIPKDVIVGGAVALELAKIIVAEKIPHIYQKMNYYVQRGSGGWIQQQQWIATTYKNSNFTGQKGRPIVHTYNVDTGKWS